MKTLNISLPAKLQDQASMLVKSGYYASLSDVIRTALRNFIESSVYDAWVDEAKHDLQRGKAIVLRDKDDVTKYIAGL